MRDTVSRDNPTKFAKFDCKIYEEPFHMEILSKKITIIHHPELINLEMVKMNDLILHGHTHRFRLETQLVV